MKAITIHQPWASLIAHGLKRFETRSWRTNYRGPIAIHASKKVDHQAVLMIARDHTHIWREISPLPTGCIVAIAELVECWKVVGRNLIEAQPPSEKRVKFIDSREKDFGNYELGRYAWKLVNVQILRESIQINGKQGLWNWDPPEDWKCVICKEYLVGGGLCLDCIAEKTEIALQEGLIL